MQRIFKELVLTERAYVKDLASVMDVSKCVCLCVGGKTTDVMQTVKLNNRTSAFQTNSYILQGMLLFEKHLL